MLHLFHTTKVLFCFHISKSDTLLMGTTRLASSYRSAVAIQNNRSDLLGEIRSPVG